MFWLLTPAASPDTLYSSISMHESSPPERNPEVGKALLQRPQEADVFQSFYTQTRSSRYTFALYVQMKDDALLPIKPNYGSTEEFLC